MRENMQCLSFWVWVFSFSTTFSRFMYLVIYFMISFFVTEEYFILRVTHFYYPLIGWWTLDCCISQLPLWRERQWTWMRKNLWIGCWVLWAYSRSCIVGSEGSCTSSVWGLLCSMLLLRFLLEAFVCASPFFTLPLVSLTFRSEGNSQDYIEFLSRVSHCAWYTQFIV